MTDKLTIGMIGNGKSANRYHLPYILTRPDKIRVKTIYQRRESNAWTPVKGVRYTQDLDVLLTDPEIQLVVITTPSQSHYELAKEVLLAGKNCVVEKPFAENSAQAKELFGLAQEKGLMLQCYQNRRFDSDFLTVQKVIESGKLGDLYELNMHFDYYRPEIPESASVSVINSFLYGHACHTVDQILSYFGKPDDVRYDVRQLLGSGHMNDYFDLDLFYGNLKVSIKSSYFRVRERPAVEVYGKRGMFIKEKSDRQEADLKKFYMPFNTDFGQDSPEDYGTLTYYDDQGSYHEEKVVTERGDYARYYDALYETMINGAEKLVKDEQTILQMEILENGIAGLK